MQHCPKIEKKKKGNAGADELALQNRENQLKNLQHQSNKRVARAAAPQGKRETEKEREREKGSGLQLFDLSAASKSAKRRKMKTVCRLAARAGAMKMRKIGEKLCPGAVDLYSQHLAPLPPLTTPLLDRKVNADKFHDLTNAAEINTATCNRRSWRSKRVLWDDDGYA